MEACSFVWDLLAKVYYTCFLLIINIICNFTITSYIANYLQLVNITGMDALTICFLIAARCSLYARGLEGDEQIGNGLSYE